MTDKLAQMVRLGAMKPRHCGSWSRFGKNIVDALRNAGHPVQMVEEHSDLIGWADGGLGGATDCCGGSVAWF